MAQRPEGLGEAFVGRMDLNGSTLPSRPVSPEHYRLVFERVLGLSQAVQSPHSRRNLALPAGFLAEWGFSSFDDSLALSPATPKPAVPPKETRKNKRLEASR